MKGGKGTPRFRPGAKRGRPAGKRKCAFRYFTMYKRAINWIASMQGLHDLDPTSIRHLPTVGLIHAIWGTPFEDIAKDVGHRRQRLVRALEREPVMREFSRMGRQPTYAKAALSWAAPGAL